MAFEELTGDWDYSTLPSNIRLGNDCWLERKDSFQRFRSQQDPGLMLGNDVRVYMWNAFSVDPGGRIFVGDETILVGAIFMCAEEITIGRRVVISYYVTIADCDFHPLDPELRKKDAVAGSPQGNPADRPPLVTKPVRIEDDVWIGIGAIILKGVRIGRGARVEAGAVVTCDVPPGMTVAGNPARVVEEFRDG